MKNNKGFTLVELMVSIAILGVVIVASLGFLASGTRSFSSVSAAVNLQYKSQLAMNNIQERLIDCNTGVTFDTGSSTLYIIDSSVSQNAETGKDETRYTAYIFKYDAAKNAVYFGQQAAERTQDGSYKFRDSAPDLLVDGVSAFKADVTSGTDLYNNSYVSEVTLNMTFFIQSKTFTGVQSVALRNSPVPATVVTTD